MKSGMQLMLESMLPPGLIQDMQTKIPALLKNIDEKLQRIDELNTKADSVLARLETIEKNIMSLEAELWKIMPDLDPNYVPENTPASIALLTPGEAPVNGHSDS